MQARIRKLKKNSAAYNKNVPLHNAANGNDLAVVQYLCEIGADMEARRRRRHVSPGRIAG